MKKILIMRFMMRAGIFCFAVLGLASCTENPSSPAQGGSVVAMRTQLDNSIIRSTFFDSRTLGTSVDSLQVTQAVFSAHNLMVRSDISDDVTDPNLAYGFINQGPSILPFDISGRQFIGESIIFAATYRRARFDIQPIHTSPDSLMQLFGPYASLFAGDGGVSGNTIIIKGFIWKGGFQIPFTYSSAMTGTLSALFDTPIIVAAGGAPMEVIVRFSSSIAFSDKTGLLMDPRDYRNAAAIDANIKSSLKAALNNSGL